MIRIAFGHQARTGKDTAADIVSEGRQVLRLSFAAPIKEISSYIQEVLNKPQEKDPNLYQTLGQSLKKVYGDDVWIEACESIISENLDKSIIVTDLRFPKEAEMLKKYGFLLVKIEREKRVIDRDPNHISEIALKNYPFDMVVTNNGTLEEFKKKISNYLDKGL